MKHSRKVRKTRFSSDFARLDALPRDAGYLLSLGPAIVWFDRATAEDILRMLEDALAEGEPVRIVSGAGN